MQTIKAEQVAPLEEQIEVKKKEIQELEDKKIRLEYLSEISTKISSIDFSQEALNTAFDFYLKSLDKPQNTATEPQKTVLYQNIHYRIEMKDGVLQTSSFPMTDLNGQTF
jgi:hypothetical protein